MYHTFCRAAVSSAALTNSRSPVVQRHSFITARISWSRWVSWTQWKCCGSSQVQTRTSITSHTVKSCVAMVGDTQSSQTWFSLITEGCVLFLMTYTINPVNLLPTVSQAWNSLMPAHNWWQYDSRVSPIPKSSKTSPRVEEAQVHVDAQRGPSGETPCSDLPTLACETWGRAWPGNGGSTPLGFLKACCAHQRTEGGERQLRKCTGPHDVARQTQTSESDTRGRDGEHQGLAFVPCTTNSEMRMGAEDALIFRFPTWSGSSRSTHARRKRRISEGLVGTFCESTTSKSFVQSRLWRG